MDRGSLRIVVRQQVPEHLLRLDGDHRFVHARGVGQHGLGAGHQLLARAGLWTALIHHEVRDQQVEFHSCGVLR